MGSQQPNISPLTSSSAASQRDPLISGLHEKHKKELENLTLTTQPLKMTKLFILAVLRYFLRVTNWIFRNCGWLIVLALLSGGVALLLAMSGGPHESHVKELLHYVRFGLWWLALGVASSIGLGSGLHTFVLYLGPHIALFTIKCVRCGRIDIKTAPYDTIQLKTGPSWLDTDCSKYGPPVYPSRVPFSSILPHVQLEAVLWGIGTALGELLPYFISKAACMSGSKLECMEELDSPSKEENGIISNHLRQMKRWFLSRAQYLNFFTILVFALVPNPLFDLAGITCGQFGIPFWKFFSATLIGKAIIKTHIQTAFIISVCNNQLLDFMENELIWMLSLVPGLASILPNLIAKLRIAKEKYITASHPVTSNAKFKKWDFSFASIWNAVVWLMLLNFFIQIVTGIAQSFLKEQQEKELAALKIKLDASESKTYNASRSSE